MKRSGRMPIRTTTIQTTVSVKHPNEGDDMSKNIRILLAGFLSHKLHYTSLRRINTIARLSFTRFRIGKLAQSILLPNIEAKHPNAFVIIVDISTKSRTLYQIRRTT